MEVILPVIAGSSAVLATGAVLYRVIRPKFPVKVNCHFCNEDTQVPYGNQNCWDCPSCDQYNGFTPDGGYNKPIPPQYTEDMNHPISAEGRPTEQFNTASENILCSTCARNQMLKVKQIANFVPFEESCYVDEVRAYKSRLEHEYRLCRGCEKKVKKVLYHQDFALLRKMEEHKLETSLASESLIGQNQISFCVLPTSWPVRLLRLVSLVCSLIIMISSVHGLLSVGQYYPLWFKALRFSWLVLPMTWLDDLDERLVGIGLVCNLLAVGIAGKERLVGADAMNCFLWVALLLLSDSILTEVARSHLLILRTVAALLTVSLILWAMLCRRYKRAASPIRIRKYRPDRSAGSSSVCSSPGSLLGGSPGRWSPGSSPHSSPQCLTEEVMQATLAPPEQEEVEPSEFGTEPAVRHLEAMRIGSASRQRAPGIFSSAIYAPVTNINGSVPFQNVHSTLSGFGSNRPLISPARFRPTAGQRLLNLELPKNGMSNVGAYPQQHSKPVQRVGSLGSLNSLRSHPLQSLSAGNSLHCQPVGSLSAGSRVAPDLDDRASLFSEHRSHSSRADRSSSGSSHSSSCGSLTSDRETTVNTHSKHAPATRGSRSVTAWAVLILSVGLNLSLLGYVLMDYKKISQYLFS